MIQQPYAPYGELRRLAPQVQLSSTSADGLIRWSGSVAATVARAKQDVAQKQAIVAMLDLQRRSTLAAYEALAPLQETLHACRARVLKLETTILLEAPNRLDGGGPL